MKRIPVYTLLILLASCSSTVKKQQPSNSAGASADTVIQDEISFNKEKECFFGDLHLHSSFSADAFALGTTITPDDAHDWAEGKTLEYFGKKIQRKAPLDFLALTDHAEYLGVIPEAAKKDGQMAGTDWNRSLNDPDPKSKLALFRSLIQMAAANKRIPEFEKPELLRSVWQRYAAVAEAHNKPGKFTSFIAFEWTSAPGNQNLHRCVIFKDKGPILPFTSLDSQDPEELWNYLDNQRSNGLEVVAIPHNGNISNGLMFDTEKTYAGAPITKAYAERRTANEPLFEMAQEKGSSETHPLLSPSDEFADFETYNFMLGSYTIAKFRKGSYVRQAYGTGQQLEEKIGANPFKFGIEGGTDNHAGMSSTEEFNYQGGNGRVTSHASVSNTGDGTPIYNSPGGLTGVWAESNTRASIFEAFKRKETFGTSGGRIKVRFFAGWNYEQDLYKKEGWIKEAYANGVAMGSDLPAGKSGQKPVLLIQAIKDPESGNLDRVQVIKITTKGGRSTEQVIDVLWSGDRIKDPKTGKVPSVGNTVDLKTATYQNTIGVAALTGTWTDNDFDPTARVCYYIRVIEIPTPRWSTYWSAETNQGLNPKMPAIIRERAWTSPIWYTPAKQISR
jgi:hypothetical protein